MFLHVADYRTGLLAGNFDAFIFITSDIPNFHEIDTAAFVGLWAKKKHRMGTTKESIQRFHVEGGASPPSQNSKKYSI